MDSVFHLGVRDAQAERPEQNAGPPANESLAEASVLKPVPLDENVSFDAGQPYRSFDLCERMKHEHGAPLPVQVYRRHAWRWGPFATGTVKWGTKVYRVFATPWFSIWFGGGRDAR